jgi:hypothetical protein
MPSEATHLIIIQDRTSNTPINSLLVTVKENDIIANKDTH